MEILRLEQIELTQQVAVWNEAFSDYLVPAGMDEANFVARMEKLQLSSHASLVVKVGEELGGIALTGNRILGGKHVSWIGGIAVVPKFRKQGLSRKLMNALLENDKANGIEQAWLEVISENTPARDLYLKLGYGAVNDLVFLKGSLKDYRKVGYVLKEVFDHAKYIDSEDALTPWQNRITSHTNVAAVWYDEKKVGFIAYNLAKDDQGYSLSLLQVQIEKPQHILGVLQTFYDLYGAIPFTLVNQDAKAKYIPELLTQGFETIANQIQMRKNL
ncbi:hypothetical protein UE46_08990 [Listeria weihenstephanensis]|uniref:N-acetyltransferase domain-containing protein n=1 Tax=Listeria weihenstephanensis TaxID=1006155 RepID=A0A1S7FUP4_9LIST|nr:GNAT family N-acetyltransferase [Listeria weihenstephanensis]AQY51171.1 hypothetical protein UE46_08990 [Listeria weihenstephanensis]